MMNDRSWRVLRRFGFGVAFGSATLILFLTMIDPVDIVSELPLEAPQEEPDSMESGVAGPLAMEALLERLEADRVAKVTDLSRELSAAFTLDEWMGIQLRILEHIDEPSLCEEVLRELKQLKENAYLAPA